MMLNKTNLIFLSLLLSYYGADGLLCYNCSEETRSCYKPSDKDATVTCTESKLENGIKSQCFAMDFQINGQSGVLRGCVPPDVDDMCGEVDHQNRKEPQLVESCILCSTDLCNSEVVISVRTASGGSYSAETNVLDVYFCIAIYILLKIF